MSKPRPERKSGNYILENAASNHPVHIIFSMKEQVGALAEALKIFKVIKSNVYIVKLITKY